MKPGQGNTQGEGKKEEGETCWPRPPACCFGRSQHQGIRRLLLLWLLEDELLPLPRLPLLEFAWLPLRFCWPLPLRTLLCPFCRCWLPCPNPPLLLLLPLPARPWLRPDDD